MKTERFAIAVKEAGESGMGVGNLMVHITCGHQVTDCNDPFHATVFTNLASAEGFVAQMEEGIYGELPKGVEFEIITLTINTQ